MSFRFLTAVKVKHGHLSLWGLCYMPDAEKQLLRKERV